jgi:3-hydroxyisobutyrate dehydrogenase-like beta-hydroxyacid dehydrogenase
MNISVIGTGLMGSGITTNLLKAGHNVVIWNRDQAKLQPLVKLGAKPVSTITDAVKDAELIFEVTADDESSRSVWLGDDGILNSCTTSQTLITCATLSIIWIDELSYTCGQRGLRFLDMPMTGGRMGAESGNLKLLVGGCAETLEMLKPTLSAISSHVFRFGEAGSGMRFKLMLNTLSAIHINAAAQAVEIAKKSGINPEDFVTAIFEGDMGPASPATNLLFKGMDTPDDFLNFSVKWIEKDLRYAKQMSEKYGDFNLLDDTQSDYAEALKLGLGDMDWTKIIKIFRDGTL